VTYEEVCSGLTGHNEVVQIAYDPSLISTADILRFFWESHDPTQGNRQGNDRGTQYRSGIYCTSSAQMKTAEESREAYQARLSTSGSGTITTEIAALGEKMDGQFCAQREGKLCEFFYAEDYHQQYLAKPGARPYCSAQPQGVSLGNEWSHKVPKSLGGPAKLDESFWTKHGPKRGCSVVRQSNEPIAWLAGL
jgi:peptide-methionine (S)-S-oxide reductase